MEKEKGFTLLELMIAIAILAILVSMLNPLFSSITKANEKAQEINELDLNLGKTIDVFKRAVRSSKTMENAFGSGGNTTTSGIYISSGGSNPSGNPTNSTTGTGIVVNVPKQNGTNFIDEKVFIYYDDTNNKLFVNSTDDPLDTDFSSIGNPTELVRNLKSVSFTYDENIALMELIVYTDKNKTETKTIKEAAVTRINIDF